MNPARQPKPRCKVRTCADVNSLSRAVYIAPVKRETHAEFMARIAPRFDSRKDAALRTQLELELWWRLRELMA